MSEKYEEVSIDEFEREGGSAFPLEFVDSSDSEFDGQQLVDFGMSLRDYFAAKTMQALISNQELWSSFVTIAARNTGDKLTPSSLLNAEQLAAANAYRLADAMIKERNRK